MNKLYFLTFVTVFFLTLFVSSNKTFLLLFFIVAIILFFVFKKSLFESIYLTLLISLPFEKNIREWIFYPDITGYYYFFGISPKIILGFLLFFLIALPKYKHLFKNIKKTTASSFLLLFILGSLIASLFQSRISFVFVGFIRLWLSVFFYFATIIFFSQEGKTHILKSFLLSLTIFSIFIGTIQFVKQAPLGKFIELTPSFSKEGYFTTDGIKQYRVAGFISHPVYFGSFLSILTPILVGLLFLNQKNYKKFYFFLFLLILNIIVLIGTASRSTWINLVMIFACFFLYKKKHPFSFPKIGNIKKYQKIFLSVLILIILIPATNVFIIRIKSLSSLFLPETGNASFRIDVAQKSLNLVKLHPLIGVGLNNSTFELIPNDFAAPAHNTILIFLTELGIPVTILFLLFLFFSLYIKKPFTKLSPLNFSCWVGLLTFLVSSQFHPLFNLDPTFDLFMFLTGYLSIWKT